VAPLGPGAWTALGFVVGLGAGGALAARLAGRSVAAGRRCSGCGATLSFWPRFPILSWFGAVPKCRECGRKSGRFHAVIEAGALLIGLAAIFAFSFPAALYAALAGWALLLVGAYVWRRFG
jgi:prepilin signal peptidase PulO-like enzyme (type II secretory pathway)